MGKHLSNGISYFNIDCVQEDNLNYIEAKHGITGYGVLVKLWRKIYMIDGYYCQWSEKNIYLFSKEVALPVEQINEIVESCLNENIFSREMYEKYQVLTSSGVQKRWLKIVTDAKRINRQIDENLKLLEKSTEQKSKTPEELPQSKVKESKEKKKVSALPAAAPPELVSKKSKKKTKKEEPPEPYWQSLVDVWFDFGVEKFGVKPSFFGQDPKLFRDIVKRLRLRTVEKNKAWDEVSAPKRVRAFLDACFADQWICKNFLLKNIHTQFDKFIQSQEQAFAQKKQQVTAKASVPKTFQDEVNYFFGRYQEGELNQNLMSEDFCRKFILQYDIPIESIESIQLPTELERMRAAIVSFFRQRAELKKQEVTA